MGIFLGVMIAAIMIYLIIGDYFKDKKIIQRAIQQEIDREADIRLKSECSDCEKILELEEEIGKLREKEKS